MKKELVDNHLQLEQRLKAIEARNKKVEVDKAWETSWTRRLSIGVLTYIVIVVYLHIIHNNEPFINAAVPVVGFMLSTLVLRRVKEAWQNRRAG
jgi:nicotinamide riboside transporter PnuC